MRRGSDSAESTEMQARARQRAAIGLDHAASYAERAAGWAEGRPPAARAAPVARGVSRRLQRAAAYVDERDLGGMKSDLAEEVERSPVRMLLLAAGTGFLLGSLFR